MAEIENTDEPGIDPGEIALAVIGVRAVVSHAVERVTAAQLEEMRNLPRKIKVLARRLCRDQLEGPEVSSPNYNKLLEELSQPLEEPQLEAMAAALPPDMGLPFLNVSHKAFSYLADNLPKSTFWTFAGARNLPVPDVDFWRFVAKLDLLDQPLSVFSLMATGQLLPSQAACLREIYPTLTKAVDKAIREAVENELVHKKSYQLPLYAEWGVSRWFDIPIPGLDVLQSTYQGLERTKEGSGPKDAKPSVVAKQTLSAADRAAFGSDIE